LKLGWIPALHFYAEHGSPRQEPETKDVLALPETSRKKRQQLRGLVRLDFCGATAAFRLEESSRLLGDFFLTIGVPIVANPKARINIVVRADPGIPGIGYSTSGEPLVLLNSRQTKAASASEIFSAAAALQEYGRRGWSSRSNALI